MSRPKPAPLPASERPRPAREEEEGPRLGALLRLAYQALAQELSAWLGETGYRDLQPSHSAALQSLWGKPEGLRLTAMAKAAHVTKQSMSALVDHLERTGYVERVADPDDGRAARIRLTARGRSYTKDARAFSRRVETELDGKLGPVSVQELRAALRFIHENYPSQGDPEG